MKLACQRHLRDIEEGHKRGLHWDLAAARHGIGFYGYLRHGKGEFAGKPFQLEPWQQFYVGCAFGWKREDGFRRFTTALLVVGKKNGKSTLLAGSALYCFVADGEKGAEVYAAATKKDQAKLVFDEAKRMVRGSLPLKSRIRVLKNNMSVAATYSKFEPLSADADAADGINPSFVSVDELHRHKTRALLDLMAEGSGAREQPFLMIITTGGDDNPESPYNTELDHAKDVLEGTVEDDSYFALLYLLDKGDDWRDPKNWIKANPNLGVSVKLQDMKNRIVKAKNSPSAASNFKRLRLNINQSEAQRAIDMEKWAACSRQAIDFDALVGRRCCTAIDLSSKIDITAQANVFPPDPGENQYRVQMRFWMPEENIEEAERRDKVPYRRWVEQGWIEATPGNVVDQEAMYLALQEDRRLYRIEDIAFDPYNATHLSTRLMDSGLPVVEFPQTIRTYNEPTKRLLELIVAGQFDHGNNPVLNWMAGSMKVIADTKENMMPSKKHSRRRIDGITACIMGVGRVMAAGENTLPDNFGVRVI